MVWASPTLLNGLQLRDGKIRIGTDLNYTDFSANSIFHRIDNWSNGQEHYLFNRGFVAGTGDYNYYGTSGNNDPTTDMAMMLGDVSGFTVGLGSADGESLSTERFRITPTGNVGIGTDAPTASLDIRGAVNIENSENTVMYLKGYGTNNFNGNFINFDVTPNAGYEKFARTVLTFNKGTDGSPSLSFQRRSADNTFNGSLLSFSDDNGWNFYTTSDPAVGPRNV